MNRGILYKSLNGINYYLTSKQKKQGSVLLLLLIVSSLFDVIGLASIVPVIIGASQKGYIFENRLLNVLYKTFGIENEHTFLLVLISLIFIFFLIKNAYSTWVNYKYARFSAKIANNVINSQYEKYHHLPFIEINNIGYINLMYYILGIPTEFISGVFLSLFTILSESLILIIIVAGIIVFKPVLLLLLSIIMIPAGYFTYTILKKHSKKVGQRINELRPLANGAVADALLGHVEVLLAGKQQDFKERIMSFQREIQLMEARSFLLGSIPQRIIEMVAVLGIVVIFFYSVLFAENSVEIISILGLFAAAAYRLMPSVNRLMVSVVELKRNEYSMDMLKQYREQAIAAVLPAQQSLLFKKSLVLHNLSFAFPNQAPILKNINLTIAKGEKIGIIGKSGSGKTTLINILLRLYQQQSGSVLVDGIPITTSHTKAWQNMIAYVKQDTFLMNASIIDNITLFDENPNMDWVKEVIKNASLTNFVDTLPLGINTLIGDRGSKLSGGQRQRIGIARALYKKTQLVIFDEATSSLDNETEKDVNESIKNLSGTDITIIIIAHRTSSLKECDRIYKISGGEINDEYAYHELLNELA